MNGINAKIVLRDLDLIFEGQTFKILIFLNRSELAQKCAEVFCRSHNLSSNGVSAKIALCDIDLPSEGKKLKILIFETVTASAEKCMRVFCRFWYLPSKGSMKKLYYVTLIYFLKVKILDYNIFETVRASAKLCRSFVVFFLHLPSKGVNAKNCTTWPWPIFFVTILKLLFRWKSKNWHKNVLLSFVDFDICHRTVPMRKWYSVFFTYFLKVKSCKCSFTHFISETARAGAKMCQVVCRFVHLPSNAVMAKLVLCDLDLHFDSQKIKMLTSRKRWEVAQTCELIGRVCLIQQNVHAVRFIYS